MDTPAYKEEKLTLRERRHEYGDVYTYVFTSENPVIYTAAQYGHVRLFGMPEGEKAVREFSFASAPSDAEIWFGIDSRSGSAYQKALQALPIGGAAGLFKIKGHMEWPTPRASIVMIAGGVGVTPFRSMLRDIEHKKMPITASLIHASRDGFLYQEELSKLPVEYLRVSREGLPSAIKKAAAENREAQYYVAGSPGFVLAAADMLFSAGITAIQADPFKGLAE